MIEDIQSLANKPVLVAGASGFVGSHIMRLLVKQVRNVRVLLRKSSNTDALKGLLGRKGFVISTGAIAWFAEREKHGSAS